MLPSSGGVVLSLPAGTLMSPSNGFLRDLGIFFSKHGQLVFDVADLLRFSLKQLQLIRRKLILGGFDGVPSRNSP